MNFGKENKRRLFSLILIAVLVFNLSGIANAERMGAISTQTTSGGTGGCITIYSEIYRNSVFIYSGVYRYDFGVVSYIANDPNEQLKTNFTITGNYYPTQNSSGQYFSTGIYGTRCGHKKSSQSSNSYFSLYTTTNTTSTAFGDSTQYCNRDFT